MVDIRQSLQYGKYLSSLGWKVERIGEVNYFIRKFPLIGSILKIQRPKKIDFDTIDELCRKYRVFQVILEPKDSRQQPAVISHGFRLSRNPYLPSKTLQIDLSQSQKEIFSHIKKNARYSIKRGEALKIKSYTTPEELKKWRDAWKNSVKLDRYVPSIDTLINIRKSFPQDRSLFLASHNIVGSVIGGALFTTSSHGLSNYITYYWYGFTNSEGRTSLSQYALLYQGILWAKRHGYKLFDFEGVYDDRFPNKSWLGFSHFKKSFGGREVLYPGCYTKTSYLKSLMSI